MPDTDTYAIQYNDQIVPPPPGSGSSRQQQSPPPLLVLLLSFQPLAQPLAALLQPRNRIRRAVRSQEGATGQEQQLLLARARLRRGQSR